MHKIAKIFIIFIMALTVFIGSSNAETTNLYNDIDTDNESVLDENTVAEDFSNTSTKTTTYSSASSASMSALSSIPEANLGLNNVLCIILIAIGILIILLAIAILIRLNR